MKSKPYPPIGSIVKYQGYDLVVLDHCTGEDTKCQAKPAVHAARQADLDKEARGEWDEDWLPETHIKFKASRYIYLLEELIY